ncbi:TVP38/TMEM64 family protein [Paenibacillus yonginensis]|nr:VTT domain-containing protein [Paenibacillus yonginensis]
MKKWLGPVIYVLLMAAAFACRDQISLLLNHRLSLMMTFLLATLLALFPIMPYKVVIAAAGLLYGPWTGALLTIAGSTLSGVLLYAAGAAWYRQDAERWLNRFSGLKRFASYVDKHPFESVLLYRLLPVVPQWALNVYAGLASIPFGLYLAASILGKLPGILVYAYLGSSLFSRPLLALEILGLYIMFVLVGVWGYKKRSAAKPDHS